jgi:hypothetical protein
VYITIVYYCFSSLKIAEIEGLPEHYKFKSRNKPSATDPAALEERLQKVKERLKEESNVSARDYKFKGAKEISVEDSISLQKHQRSKCEVRLPLQFLLPSLPFGHQLYCSNSNFIFSFYPHCTLNSQAKGFVCNFCLFCLFVVFFFFKLEDLKQNIFLCSHRCELVLFQAAQLQHATERLAAQLNIKGVAYNPSQVDMAYPFTMVSRLINTLHAFSMILFCLIDLSLFFCFGKFLTKGRQYVNERQYFLRSER